MPGGYSLVSVDAFWPSWLPCLPRSRSKDFNWSGLASLSWKVNARSLVQCCSNRNLWPALNRNIYQDNIATIASLYNIYRTQYHLYLNNSIVVQLEIYSIRADLLFNYQHQCLQPSNLLNVEKHTTERDATNRWSFLQITALNHSIPLL